MPTLQSELDYHRPCADGIKERLLLLGSIDPATSQAQRSFWVEHHLSCSNWAALILSLCGTRADSMQVKQVCTDVFRRCKLSGDPIPRADGRLLVGRVARWDRFANFLMEGTGLGLTTPEDAETRLQGMLERDIPAVLADLKDFPLARYVAWGTFSMSGGRPFEGYDESPRSLQANLGLSDDKPDMAVVCFEYELPCVSARFPTVADAYAGDEWNYYFCPALPGAASGETVPWPNHATAKKRPEIVHEPMMLSDLTRPLRIRP